MTSEILSLASPGDSVNTVTGLAMAPGISPVFLSVAIVTSQGQSMLRPTRKIGGLRQDG